MRPSACFDCSGSHEEQPELRRSIVAERRILRSALLMLAIASGQISAQVTTGTIVGGAAAPTGAVIPNAAVTAIHLGTKDTRRTVTNERGEFSIPFVRIGEHSVSVEKQGF